jgi:hypothetical protein
MRDISSDDIVAAQLGGSYALQALALSVLLLIGCIEFASFDRRYRSGNG